jgi:hypothetical protein
MLATSAIQTLLAHAETQGNDRSAREFEMRLRQALTAYGGARAVAAEITTAAVSLSVDAIVFHQMTPGMLTLGPSIAAVVAQQAAIEAFPLGTGLGAIWYSLFPASPSPELVVSITVGLGLSALPWQPSPGSLRTLSSVVLACTRDDCITFSMSPRRPFAMGRQAV